MYVGKHEQEDWEKRTDRYPAFLCIDAAYFIAFLVIFSIMIVTLFQQALQAEDNDLHFVFLFS